MSTAVLISGQLRTFAQCYPTQRWSIFRHYEPDIHFFVSVVSDPANGAIADLYDHYPADRIHVEIYEDPTDLPVIPESDGQHAPYTNAATHEKLMLQHWGNKKVYDFFESQSASPARTFDTIIRLRPDQFIHRFTKPDPLYSNYCYTPWWGKFGGVNDRIAIMGPTAAKAYFTVYDRIPDLLAAGCPFHPESLVASALDSASSFVIRHSSLLCACSTQRPPGDPRGTRRWPEISAEDLAELIASK